MWSLKIKKYKNIKFGTLDSKGNIVTPEKMNNTSLKFMLTSRFTLTESQTVNWLYSLTLLFITLAFLVIN